MIPQSPEVRMWPPEKGAHPPVLSAAMIQFEQARAGARIGIISRSVRGGRNRYYWYTTRNSACGWYFGTPQDVHSRFVALAEAVKA